MEYSFLARRIRPGESADLDDRTDRLTSNARESPRRDRVEGTGGGGGQDEWEFVPPLEDFRTDSPGAFEIRIGGEGIDVRELLNTTVTAG